MAAGSGGAGFGARFGGGAAAAGLAGSGFAGLAASSSAMMRRMEARISSIDGSWAFAGWFMAASFTAPGRVPSASLRESRPSWRHHYASDYRRSKGEGKQQPVDRREIGRGSGRE